MHYSRHHLTTSVTMLTHVSTNDHWARPDCLLVSSSKTTSPWFSLVQLRRSVHAWSVTSDQMDYTQSLISAA